MHKVIKSDKQNKKIPTIEFTPITHITNKSPALYAHL